MAEADDFDTPDEEDRCGDCGAFEHEHRSSVSVNGKPIMVCPGWALLTPDW